MADVEVSSHSVVSVIEKNILQDKIPELASCLGLQRPYEWWKKENKNGSLFDTIMYLMISWISLAGTGATVNQLIVKLNEIQCRNVAEHLENFVPVDKKSEQKSNNLTFFDCLPLYINEAFYGRKKELSRLEKFLQSTMRLVLISGPGGVGKSSLARTLALKFECKRNCLLFRAEDSSLLYNGIFELAEKLGIESKINPSCNPFSAVNSRNAKNALEMCIIEIRKRNSSQFLLIFDNVVGSSTETKVLAIISSIRKFKDIHICVTSINRKVFNRKDTVHCPLSALDDEGAFELVKNYLPHESDDKIEILCRRLSKLPIVLAQIGGYVKHRRIHSTEGYSYSIDDFLGEIEENPGEVLKYVDDPEDPRTLLSIWDNNLKLFKKTRSKEFNTIQDILGTLSVVNADGIKIETLIQLTLGDINAEESRVLSVKECLELLKSFSMIQAENNIVSIHQLVQEVIRIRNNNDNERMQRISANWLRFLELREPDCGSLVHFKSIWRITSKSFKYQIPYGKIGLQICLWMLKLHDNVAAAGLSRTAIEFLSKMPKKDENSLRELKHFHGLAHHKQNDYVGALNIYKNFDAEELEGGKKFKFIAMSLAQQQDYANAIHYENTYYTYVGNTPGKEDEARRTLKRLACLHYKNGDIEKSRELYEKVYSTNISNWRKGVKSDDTVEVVTSLHLSLVRLNEHQRANDILNAAHSLVISGSLRNSKNFLSISIADDPFYFSRVDFFTQVFQKAEDYYSIICDEQNVENRIGKLLAKATLNFSLGNINCCQTALEEVEQILPEDETVPQCRTHLNWLQIKIRTAREEYETCEYVWEEFSTKCNTLCGPWNSYTCDAKTEILKLKIRYEDPQKLLDELKEEYSSRKKRLGVAHRQTFEIAELTAKAMHQFGNPEKALIAITTAKIEMEKHFRMKNSVTTKRAIRFLPLYKQIGMISRGLEEVEEILSLCSPRDNKMMLLKHSSALLHECLGNFEVALHLAKESYNLGSKMYLKGHKKQIMIGRYYARLLNINNEPKDAGALLEDLQNILWENSQFITEDISWIKQSLALVKMKLGDMDEALKLLTTVYNWRCEQLTRQHTKTMSVRFRIGWWHYKQGNLGTAKEVYEEVLKVDLETGNKFSRANLTRRYHYAWVLKEVGNTTRAYMILEETLPNQRSTFGEEHVKTKTMEDMLDKLKQSLKAPVQYGDAAKVRIE